MALSYTQKSSGSTTQKSSGSTTQKSSGTSSQTVSQVKTASNKSTYVTPTKMTAAQHAAAKAKRMKKQKGKLAGKAQKVRRVSRKK